MYRVFEALDELSAIVEEARGVPMTAGCVVPRGDTLDPAKLLDDLEPKMPYFALPRYVRVMDHLPKTPTERVRKVELRMEGITSDTYDRAAK